MTETIHSIKTEVSRRGITRLCHFTPSRNLSHIVSHPIGLLSSRRLTQDEDTILNPTDTERMDGCKDHVCCSIQYPNAWYFQKARSHETLFRDWVVLLIKPNYLWMAGTKFCPRNSAAAFGRFINDGAEAFETLFSETVKGQQYFSRGPHHPDFLPTDEQAEVLIPSHVDKRDLIAVVVFDAEQGKQEKLRLKILGEESPPFLVVPEFFEARALSEMLRRGRTPEELPLQ